MNIYHESIQSSVYNEVISKKECKDCSVDIMPRSFHPTSTYIDEDDRFQMSRFQHCASLYIDEFEKEKWLICNPVSLGHIIVLDSDAFGLFQAFCTPTTPLDILDIHSGLLLEEVVKFIHFFCTLGFLYNCDWPSLPLFTETPRTLAAWLHVTNACNLGCSYCYIQKSADHMSIDRAYQVIDAIFRSAVVHNYQNVELKYVGGEASLQVNTVIALHDYATQLAQQHGITLHAYLLSNGVFLSTKMTKALQERHIGVAISLDGIEDQHDSQRAFLNGRGSFKYVDRTITQLLAYGLVPFISITVSQRNLSGLPELMRYILLHNLPFSINYYRAHLNSMPAQDLRFEEAGMIKAMRAAFDVIRQTLPQRSLLDSLLDKVSFSNPHQHTCGAGQDYLVIDQRGGVAKCQADIGNTLTTVDVDDPLHFIRENRTGMQNLMVDEKEGCRDCQWRYWCSSGCPLLTYQATGRNDVQSPNCNIYKALFPDVLRLEALRLLTYQSPQDFFASTALQ